MRLHSCIERDIGRESDRLRNLYLWVKFKGMSRAIWVYKPLVLYLTEARLLIIFSIYNIFWMHNTYMQPSSLWVHMLTTCAFNRNGGVACEMEGSVVVVGSCMTDLIRWVSTILDIDVDIKLVVRILMVTRGYVLFFRTAMYLVFLSLERLSTGPASVKDLVGRVQTSVSWQLS